MPTVLNERGFRFFFYSNQNTQPYHVHIEKGSASGKIWLEPSLKIEFLNEFNSAKEKDVLNITTQNIKTFKRKRYEYLK